MARVFIEESSLSAIGDAIRGKTGETELLSVSDMPDKISGIETGVDTGDATAAATDIRKSKTAYVKGVKITGTLPDATQATPSITVSSTGLISASATQTAGYVAAGTKSATKQLSAQAAKTITPSSSEQTAVAAGKYTTGAVKVAAIPSTYTQLNFTVIGGTSQPSSPAANTIWVNTSTSITSWFFSATQPTSPAAGMVWFQTGTGSNVAFNALKKNNITVYPSNCKQYVSGAWVSKTAKTYQNGAWQNWWDGELFMNGNQYSFITGGWKIVNAGVGTGKINTDSIFLGYSGSSGRESAAFTEDKVDVTAYKTLYAKVNKTNGDDFTIGLCTENTKSLPSYSYKKTKTSNGEEVMSCDISSATGKYYIGANADIANGYLYEFYMTK